MNVQHIYIACIVFLYLSFTAHGSDHSNVFSRLYLSNRRAIGMVVVKTFYMTNQPCVLNLGMQNFNYLVQGEHFQIGGWMEGVGRMCVFNRKLVISCKRWEIGRRLLLITNRKWHLPWQIKWKSSALDDFEGQWQPVWLAILATAGFLVSVDAVLLP